MRRLRLGQVHKIAVRASHAHSHEGSVVESIVVMCARVAATDEQAVRYYSPTIISQARHQN